MEFKPIKSLDIYLHSLIEAKLWVKVIVAMVLGTLLGMLLSPEAGWISSETSVTIGAWLALPGKLFMKLVQMIMIPLIFASIITGLVSASGEQLKKMGIGVTIYFILTTTVSIVIGVLLALLIKPGAWIYEKSADQYNDIGPVTELSKDGPAFSDFPTAISNLLPGNPLASMVSGEMLAIVIFTIIIGLSIVSLNNGLKQPIIKMLGAILEICMTIVKWAMRLVPYAVFGLMAQLLSSIGVKSLEGIGMYVFTVILGLLILLILYLMIVGIFGRKNPVKFLKKIRKVQLLAFSTTSSAAVMPLSIKTAEEDLGVSKGVSNFLIPVGATVNMDGTAIYQCISTLFIAQAYGMEMSLASLIMIMVTIVAASIGTPSIPGGGVVVMASVLQSVGIPTEGIVIIIGVERILGMFRTAINVTGDLTACLVFSKLEEKWNRQKV